MYAVVTVAYGVCSSLRLVDTYSPLGNVPSLCSTLSPYNSSNIRVRMLFLP
jgi:hypothetical protein